MISKTQTEEYLRNTKLPLGTDSYTVISHGDIIDKVREKLNENGFIITDELYKAERNGDIALGFMQIETLDDPDMSMTFNWTNSYNKVVAFSCSIGGFIYDNKTQFVSADSSSSWKRLHTGIALEETLDVIEAMVVSATEHFAKIIEMKEKFKLINIGRKEYAKLMGLIYFDKKLISPDQVSVLRKEYDKPSFNYTEKDTLWGFYKMLMFSIADQAPKGWYKQQVDINTYIQVLYKIASIELPNEIQASEQDTTEVTEEESMQAELDYEAQATLGNANHELYNTEIVDTESDSSFITDEEEDIAINSFFKPVTVLPCPAHAIKPEKEEPIFEWEQPEEISISMESIDNLIDAQNLIIEPKSFHVQEEIIEEDLTIQELIFEHEDAEELVEFIDMLLVSTELTDDQIEIIKEENGVVEKEETIQFETNTDSLFDLIDEVEDDSADEVPWFTDKQVDVAPSLIPDSMREAVSEILATKYQNNRTVVKAKEFTNTILFELDSSEFFYAEK